MELLDAAPLQLSFLLLLHLFSLLGVVEVHVHTSQLACEGYQKVFQAPHLWRAPLLLERCGGNRKASQFGQATGTGSVVVLGEHLCQLLQVKVGVKLCLRLLYLVEVVVQCLLHLAEVVVQCLDRKHVGQSFF